MADDRTRHVLEVVGARQFVASFAAAQQAIDSLGAATGSSGARQKVIYNVIAAAAEESAARQEQAAKRVLKAIKEQEEGLRDANRPSGRSRNDSGQFISKAEADRLADLQLRQQGPMATRGLPAADRQRLLNVIEGATFVATGGNAVAAQAQVLAQQLQQQQLADEKLVRGIQLREQQIVAAVRAGVENQITIANDGAKRRTALEQAQAERQQVIRGQFQRGQEVERRSAQRSGRAPNDLMLPSNLQAGVVPQLAATTAATNTVTQANTRKTASINTQAQAEDNAKRHSITYLSALSAVHAMSFLLGSQTFTNVGSLTTLGLAFGKVGALAGIAGVGLGVVLLGIQSVTNAANAIQQAMIAAVQAVVDFGVKGAAAMVAFGAAGVKAAADVETQFALLKGITGKTNDDLRITEKTVSDLSIEFGKSAASITEAGSLYVRAGGNLKDLETGALRAVVALQAASGGELDAANAAKAIAVAVNQFNLGAQGAERAANIIAGAAQLSALSFSQVSQAFVQATPGARSFGITAEDLGAIIVVLGDQMASGAISGTSFKQFMLDLINPSVRGKAVLREYGITIFDAAGKARPFEDVLIDLNAAMGEQAVVAGKLTQEQRNVALATLFETRAGLAGAILTRDGTEKFAQARADLTKISVSDIAGTVLSTLNSQLGRLANAAQEVAREFGKPLLKPLADGAKAAVEFISQLRPAAKTAGQAVQVALTGQGFRELIASLAELTGNREATLFFAELTNSMRLVVTTIQGQIIPAVQDFFARLAGFAREKGDVEGISNVFLAINRTIALVGAAATVALPKVADFLKEFANFEGTGGTVRDIITRLAQAIIGSLVTSIVAVVPATAAAITAMVAWGTVTAKVAQNLGNVAEFVGRTVRVFEDFGLAMDEAAERSSLGLQFSQAISKGDVDEADRLRRHINALPAIFEHLRQVRKPGLFSSQAFETAELLRQAQTLGEEVGNAVLAADVQVKQFVQDVGTLQGSLSDMFSNLVDLTREAAEPTIGTGSRGAPIGPDPEALAKAAKKLEELQADIGRRLSNINEDVITKNRELLTNALERIDDIFERAAEQIEKLADDTRKRIKELDDAFEQGRADRRTLAFASEGVRVEVAAAERGAEARQKADERALEAVRRARQRDSEDAATSYQRQTEVAERSFSQQQEAAERAFKVIQDARKESLDKQQELETKQLSQQLEDAATQRKLQQELAAATTPQERAAIQAKAGTAAQDTAFSRSQAAQLEALRVKHEKQRKRVEQAAEQEQVAFRQQQEIVVASFRIQQEGRAVVERRRVEEAERLLREREDDNAFVVRQQREEGMRVFRETKEQEVAATRDALEEQAHERARERILDEALLREQEFTKAAGKQAGEQLTEFDKRQSANLIEAERSLRGVQQSLQDTIENFIKEGTLPAGAERVVAAIGAAVGQALQALVDAQAVSRETLSNTIQQRQQALLPATAEQQQALAQQAIVPAGAVGAALQVVATLPPNFHIMIRDAFVAGLQYAATNGILPTQQIQITQGSTPQQVEDAARRGVLGR